MNIIDTHAHIDQLEDLPGAMSRAKDAGVTDIVAMSVDFPSMQKVMAISSEFKIPRIHPALGVHPGMVKLESQAQALAFLKDNIRHVNIIGETGLDFWYKWVRKDEHERNLQKDSFKVHLMLAKEYNLPIVIHSRGAWRDCLAMAKEMNVKRALFHWYSGPVDILEQILAAGYYVSTSPSVAYSVESRTAMAAAPLERILIETDAPVRYGQAEGMYMAEPKDVIKTWQALASLKAVNPDDVLKQLNQNAKDFFSLGV